MVIGAEHVLLLEEREPYEVLQAVRGHCLDHETAQDFFDPNFTRLPIVVAPELPFHLEQHSRLLALWRKLERGTGNDVDTLVDSEAQLMRGLD